MLHYGCPVNSFGCFLFGADKTAALEESVDTGAEMTEEEWNLRVAELNKHQVRHFKKTKKKTKHHTSHTINQL